MHKKICPVPVYAFSFVLYSGSILYPDRLFSLILCSLSWLYALYPGYVLYSFVSGFLSWFRNGLLATGIGVIAFVQSEVGREAGYGTYRRWILGLQRDLDMRTDVRKKCCRQDDQTPQ